MERISITNSRLVSKLKELLDIVKQEKEIDINILAKKLNTTTPRCREWVLYIIQQQKEEKLLFVNDTITTLEIHDKNSKIKIEDDKYGISKH